LSLSVAFVGFAFLSFLAFSIHAAWNGFFSARGQTSAAESGNPANSPEWRAFVDRREEIERDPLLDAQGRKTLIENWHAMASESRPHMAELGTMKLGNRFFMPPLGAPGLVLGALALTALLTYAMGAINPAAFKWPDNSRQPGHGPSVDQAVAASAGHPGDGANLEDRLAGLRERLAQQPDDLRGWILLARTHASLSNFADSVEALKKALELTPGHPDILADLADMTAMAQGRQLAGEPEKYIAAALQGNPRHEKALALAASAAEQAGDQDKAQVYWQLLSQVQQASLQNTPSEPEQAMKPPARDAIATAMVNIPLAALNRMNADSALFVFLKSQPGPGKPLAVVRVPATQLKAGIQAIGIGPNDFLDEVPMDQLPATVHVQARLSIQGMAQTSAGDIQSEPVAVDAKQLLSGVRVNLPEGSVKP